MRLVKYFNDSFHRDYVSGYIVDYEYCFLRLVKKTYFKLNSYGTVLFDKVIPAKWGGVHSLSG